MKTKENAWKNENLLRVLVKGGVVVMPTDTIYGMVGKAQNEDVVNRIYKIRNRDPKKPCIILIGDIGELVKFSINLSEKQKRELKKYWSFDPDQDCQSEPTSIVLECLDDSLAYLHRNTRTLAFRLPASRALRELLLKTGPLVAPSANKEDFPLNYDIKSIRKYFGNTVDLYVDAGEQKGKASRLFRLQKNGSIFVLRK